MSRVPVAKTCKLYIGGKYPRSESGRTVPVEDPGGVVLAHAARASRKDLRDAVEAATKAAAGWADATAYLRGQIIHRIAEFMESRRDELAEAIRSVEGSTVTAARREVDLSVDRTISFAGWTDKIAALLGGQCTVAGPFYTMSVAEPMGVCAVVAPSRPSLLGLVSVLMPPLAAGNTVVALASEENPLPAVALGEILGVSDVPAGVVNLLTGGIGEILPVMAGHRQIAAVGGIGIPGEIAAGAAEAAAESLKRVRFESVSPERSELEDHDHWTSPESVARWIEMKSIWHPATLD